MNTLPLLPPYPATRVVAYRNGQAITQAWFLRDVLDLADRLPQTGHAFNLCNDRYWFAVALFAAISRGIVNLLQNSTAAANMAALFADFPDAICLGEQAPADLHHIPYVEVPCLTRETSEREPVMPQIHSAQPIARIFTSGTTGKPQAHTMTFARMRKCAIAEAERMWEVVGGPCTVLGTVPPQHMFGLEATVLLPLFGGGQFSAAQPFFAADVAAALAEVPEPRLLVSTPFHLRKLMDAQITLPRISATLSATAPLSLELAKEVEAQTHSPMVEIYGSTETGALATRLPTQESIWTSYEGIHLVQIDDETRAVADHFDSPQLLNDRIELIKPERFRLLGRHSDMINIVGKRSSLAFLNQLLLGLQGVDDGIFCVHESEVAEEAPRLMAFVVAPQVTRAEILAALRRHIDPVFLPRPLVLVDALERDANGKITAMSLAALRAKHISGTR